MGTRLSLSLSLWVYLCVCKSVPVASTSTTLSPFLLFFLFVSLFYFFFSLTSFFSHSTSQIPHTMDPHAGTGRVVLPTNVRPTHYDLTLTPDLTTFNFYGQVLINLDINKPTTAITLNSNQLDLISAKLTNLALKTESR